MKPQVEVFVLSLLAPFNIGIYENGILIDTKISNEKTSEALPILMNEILKKYQIKALYFLKGPGSFMSIKITYVFLSTLSIVFDCPMFASDGFSFNENSPIKAVGKSFFVKQDNEISIKKLQNPNIKEFVLPKRLDKNLFSDDCEPLYILPAV